MAALRNTTALRALARRPRVPSQLARAFHVTARRQEHFLNADVETFEKAISNKERLVLVDFYAEWCKPCKVLSPILEQLTSDPSVTSKEGKPVDLVTIDTDEHIELSERYNIRALPTVVAFAGGKPVDQFVGVQPQSGVHRFIQSI